MNLMCKVFRFRDRLPVHRLFVKIFSWFWVTALVMAPQRDSAMHSSLRVQTSNCR